MVLCHGIIILFDTNYFYPSIAMIAMDYLLLKEVRKINLSDRKACGMFFQKNNYYGIGIFLFLLLLNLIRFLNPEEEK